MPLNSTLANIDYRQYFLRDFYSAVKAAFVFFDFYATRSELVTDFGFNALLQSIPDLSSLNQLAALAARLGVSEAFMYRLQARSSELGQDIDTFLALYFSYT